MRTLFTYIMVFPRRSAFVLLALLIAGIAEGLSLTALLPLISIAVGESDSSNDSGVGRFIENALQNIGIEPALDTILLIIVGGMFFKGIVLLLANRQVGYTVAHVAPALRLDLIEALLASRWQYYLRQSVGSLANSVATEAYRAANGFEHSVNVLALAIQVIVYAIVALFISWEATLASLFIGLFPKPYFDILEKPVAQIVQRVRPEYYQQKKAPEIPARAPVPDPGTIAMDRRCAPWSMVPLCWKTKLPLRPWSVPVTRSMAT